MINRAVALLLTTLAGLGGVSAAPVTALLSVAGLDCSSWPLNIRPAVMTLGGVSNVKIDLDRRQLRVDFDDAAAESTDLVRVLQGLGLAATVVRIERGTRA